MQIMPSERQSDIGQNTYACICFVPSGVQKPRDSRRSVGAKSLVEFRELPDLSLPLNLKVRCFALCLKTKGVAPLLHEATPKLSGVLLYSPFA